MFGLGFPEIMLIMVIALVVFGPKKLPELGKSIGRAMAEFKKASEDFQESVKAEMKEVEKTSGVDEIKKIGEIDLSPYEEPKTEAPAREQDTELKPTELSTEPKPKKKKTREEKQNG